MGETREEMNETSRRGYLALRLHADRFLPVMDQMRAYVRGRYRGGPLRAQLASATLSVLHLLSPGHAAAHVAPSFLLATHLIFRVPSPPSLAAQNLPVRVHNQLASCRVLSDCARAPSCRTYSRPGDHSHLNNPPSVSRGCREVAIQNRSDHMSLTLGDSWAY